MNKATTPAPVFPTSAYTATVNGTTGGTVVGTYITYRMQYKDANSNWITYDTKYGCPLAAGTDSSHGGNSLGWSATGSSPGTVPSNPLAMVWCYTSTTSDPRSHRFGMFTHFDQSNPGYHTYNPTGYTHCFIGQENGGAFDVNGTTYGAATPGVFETAWLNLTNNVIASFRQDMFPGSYFDGPYKPTSASGWNIGTLNGYTLLHPGLLSQNCSQVFICGNRFINDGQGTSLTYGAADYYADPDGVLRRADGGYVAPGDSNSPVISGQVANPNSEYGTADTTMGLPMTQVGAWGGGAGAPSTGIPTQINNSTSSQTAGQTSAFALNTPSGGVPTQNVSRPYILHRPFRSVGEMGYAFRDTPWKSIDFSKPESADSALLDVFTLNENNNANGLEAGKIDLNTRQPAVLAALLANAYLDDPETSSTSSTYTATGATAATAVIGGADALALAQGIVTRTTDTADTGVGSGPFQNICELVGKWNNQALTASPLVHPTNPQATPATGPANTSGFIDGMLAYVGFSGMPTPPAGTQVTQTVWTSSTSNSSTLNTSANPNLMSLYTATSTASTFGVFPTTSAPKHAGLPEAMAYAKRYHEAPIRALVNGTQTRVWNLMIDVIAQTGRFPSSAGSLANFNVEGERRYWVHVAIDRYTGKVLDEQVEEVKE